MSSWSEDWTCNSCQAANFRSRNTCARCGAYKFGGSNYAGFALSEDWTCNSCQAANFGSCNTCFRCGAYKFGGSNCVAFASSEDWTCNSCQAANFGSRKPCFRCGAYNFGGSNYLGFAWSEDWICNSCQAANFGSRNTCYRCAAYKFGGSKRLGFEKLFRKQPWSFSLFSFGSSSSLSEDDDDDDDDALMELAPFSDDDDDDDDALMELAPFDMSDIVGIGGQVRKVKSLLCRELYDVRVVGIWGMAGIGKSTIASTVYHKIAHQYDCSCFLADIGDKYTEGGGDALKADILSQLLPKFDFNTTSTEHGISLLKSGFYRRKVLLVLDDVNNIDQLHILVRSSYWFGRGSRIIITTRDRRLLNLHGVDLVYKVKHLMHDQALRLFCKHAFKKDRPDKGYVEISNQFVSYAGGLPLALKDLGRSLYKRRIEDWKSALTKADKFDNIEIINRLKRSFDELNYIEKQVFLDIACFFNGMNDATVRNVLDGCRFVAGISLQILVGKSLITISDSKLFMHNLLQELGHYIVHQESVEPGNRSRLWDPYDICHLLQQSMETPKVEAMSLDMSKVDVLHLNSTSFNGMRNLRLLKFFTTSSLRHASTVQVPEGIEFLSTRLRYFYWFAYPLKSRPSSLYTKTLVELHLPYSNIEELWAGKQNLVNLKLVDVVHSNLSKLPDLSGAPNLLSLYLQGCSNLFEASSLQCLSKLEYLNMEGCKHIKRLPHMVGLGRLQYLNLLNCSNLKRLPDFPTSLERLYLGGTAIEVLPASVEHLYDLVDLDLNNCTRLKRLPDMFSFGHLRDLVLSNCSNLEGLPNLPKLLRNLYLGGTAIEELPSSVRLLYNLVDLDLNNCTRLKSLPDMGFLIRLRYLDLSNCPNLERLPRLPINLKHLYLRGTTIGELPSSFWLLYDLVDLDLNNCTRLKTLPDMGFLRRLRYLDLSNCSNLERLPLLPISLEHLYLGGTAIEELTTSIGHLRGLVNLDVSNCVRLKSLPSSIVTLKSLKSLNIFGCSGLLGSTIHDLLLLGSSCSIRLPYTSRLHKFERCLIHSVSCQT